MINKLSQDQKTKIPEYLKYWLAQGRRVETINRERAKESIDFLYSKILKIDKPKLYVFLDSPMACQLFLNSSNQLESQLWNQLESQLGSQLRRQLWSQLGNQLGNQLWSQLGSQLWNQLGNQLGSQLRRQLESQLGSQLGRQLESQLESLMFVNESKTNWTQAYCWVYSYILNELFPEKKKDFGLFLDYLEHSKHYHHVYLSPEVAVFSDFPKTIILDSAGRLDSSESKALEYRDGYGFYACNGAIANSRLELELL
jgi:hypothetical protein